MYIYVCKSDEPQAVWIATLPYRLSWQRALVQTLTSLTGSPSNIDLPFLPGNPASPLPCAYRSSVSDVKSNTTTSHSLSSPSRYLESVLHTTQHSLVINWSSFLPQYWSNIYMLFIFGYLPNSSASSNLSSIWRHSCTFKCIATNLLYEQIIFRVGFNSASLKFNTLQVVTQIWTNTTSNSLTVINWELCNKIRAEKTSVNKNLNDVCQWWLY